MSKPKKTAALHTIRILDGIHNLQPCYQIEPDTRKFPEVFWTLEDAIEYLRARGCKAAQLINEDRGTQRRRVEGTHGPRHDVYILSWGVLLEPSEGA